LQSSHAFTAGQYRPRNRACILGKSGYFASRAPKCRATAIPADLRINPSAELIVVDEEMPLILDVFGAHDSYREILAYPR